MDVISFVMEKGGSGKSTLAKNVAVAASESGRRVLIIDLDPQGSAEAWFQRRQAETPHLVKIQPNEVDRALAAARTAGTDLVVIDTPGRDQPGLRAAVAHSDVCVVPCRSTIADMEVVTRTAAFITAQKTMIAFVISQTPPRGFRLDDARRALSHLGLVCETAIVSRATYWDADAEGLGVTEFDPASKAASETRALWTWLQSKIKKVDNDHEAQTLRA